MRQVIAVIALALCLLGCGPARGEQVPLRTYDEPTAFGDGCVLTHQVADVIADPRTGTPTVRGSEAWLWPKGFTAWRVGTEVEVLDPGGGVVLTTGGRYWMCPVIYSPQAVVGIVRPCPDCELGGGPD